ncbi:MAG TPA: hypothetical protein EYQ27_01690 [Gemmatimonadetes bacterium]|nr:hypothetical protein [Gemmatimonadota bacterium]
MITPRDSRLMRRAICTLALAVTLTSCAQQSRQLESPFNGPREEADQAVRLTVENNDFRDATIYMYWNGMKSRVGRVTGKTSKTFTVEWRSEEAQLGANFLGRGGFRTETIGVDPGDHLNLVIPIR